MPHNTKDSLLLSHIATLEDQRAVHGAISSDDEAYGYGPVTVGKNHWRIRCC